MSDYIQVTVEAKFSESTSFSQPKLATDFDAYESGAGTFLYEVRKVSAATGGTTIDLAAYASISNILIKNKDGTNYVEATFRTTGGGSNDQVLRCPAGSIVMTGSAVTVANDLVLTAHSAAVACEVCIIGA
jgi:hypothetical protein